MGEAVPKGSTKSFHIKKLDRVITTNANPNTEKWEAYIRAQAQEYSERSGLFFNEGEAVEISATFHLSRPKSLPKKVKDCVKRPDLDKLTRCVGDALNRVLFNDDSQVVKWTVEKMYAAGPSFVAIELRGRD